MTAPLGVNRNYLFGCGVVRRYGLILVKPFGNLASASSSERVSFISAAAGATQALRALADLITPMEQEVRMHCHDLAHPHHEVDYHCYAVHPLESLQDARIVQIAQADGGISCQERRRRGGR